MSMFIVTLRFSANRSKAAELMAEHNAWISRGFEDKAFIVTGSLATKDGGVVIAHAASRDEIERRVSEDPFVVHDVVTADIVEFVPGKVDDRLGFLLV